MKEKLLDILNTVLNNKGSEKLTDLSPEMHLRNDIGLDSLDLAELTVRIEEAFDIDIFENGVVNTVSEVFEKLETKNESIL